MKQMIPLSDQVDSYLKHLSEVRRASASTVKNYRSSLQAFLRKHRVLTVQSVSSFVSGINQASSANTVLTRLRGLADFLEVDLSRIPRAKEFVKDPEALNSGEVSRLLGVCDKTPDRGFSPGVAFLAYTGLRLHEFQALRAESLQTRDGVSFVRILGKGKKFRDVPLSERALKAFQSLELPYPMKISDRRFRKLLAQAGKEAGIAFHVNPHKLRSSFASILMNERQADSAHVAKICGWTKIDTMVARYYKPDIRTLHGAL